jgi:hypothetical protein
VTSQFVIELQPFSICNSFQQLFGLHLSPRELATRTFVGQIAASALKRLIRRSKLAEIHWQNQTQL